MDNQRNSGIGIRDIVPAIRKVLHVTKSSKGKHKVERYYVECSVKNGIERTLFAVLDKNGQVIDYSCMFEKQGGLR